MRRRLITTISMIPLNGKNSNHTTMQSSNIYKTADGKRKLKGKRKPAALKAANKKKATFLATLTFK